MNLFNMASRSVDLGALPDDDAPRSLIDFGPAAGAPSRGVVPPDLDPLFEAAASEYGVDPTILKGIAYAESRFRPDVINGTTKSSAGALGMMQFMPDTAKEMGINPLDPVESVFGAAAYLRQSLDKFDGDAERAIASYNWGRNRSAFDRDDWFKSLPTETRNYVGTVLEFADGVSFKEPPPVQGVKMPLPAGVTPSSAGAGRGTLDDPRNLNNPENAPQAPFYERVVDSALTLGKGVAASNPVLGRMLNIASGPKDKPLNSVLEGVQLTGTPTDLAEAQRLSRRDYAENAERARFGKQAEMRAPVAATGAQAFAEANPLKAAFKGDAARTMGGALNLPSVVAGVGAETVNRLAADAGVAPVFGRVGNMPLVDDLRKVTQDYASSLSRRTPGQAWDNGEFGRWMMTQMAGNSLSAAQSLGALFLPGAQATLLGSMGATAAGSAYADGDSASAAALKGLVEVGSEKLPLSAAEKIKDLVLAIPAPARNQVLAEAGKRLLAAGTAVSANSLVGAIEETAAEIGGNVIDKYVQGKNKGVFDEVDRAALVGAAFGGGMSAPAVAQIAAGPESMRARELSKALNDDGLPPGATVEDALRTGQNNTAQIDPVATSMAAAAGETARLQVRPVPTVESQPTTPQAPVVTPPLATTPEAKAVEAVSNIEALLGSAAPTATATPAPAQDPVAQAEQQLAEREAPPQVEMQMRPAGTLLVKGDPAAIRARLLPAGVDNAIDVPGGLVVSRTQAAKAQEVLSAPTQPAVTPQQEVANVPQGQTPQTQPTAQTTSAQAPVVQRADAAVPASAVPAAGGAATAQANGVGAPATTVSPVRIGRDQTLIADGGRPFKTRKAAGDAKKLQPMMRVVQVEGGYALAEKTPAQLAAEQKAAKRLATPKTSAIGEPIPAHSFVAAAGGLSPASASDLGVDGNPRIGNRRLFARAGAGLSMDQATQMLVQDGYLSAGATINDALALIKRSLTQPQYNSEGIERIAEASANAQFDDYLAAQEELAQDGDPDPFNMADSFTAEELDEVGYTQADPALQAEVSALIAQAEASEIDTYAILEDIARTYADATQDQYNAAARGALAQAITRSGKDGGSAVAQTAPASEPANATGLSQASRQAAEPLELAALSPAAAAALQESREASAKAEAAAKRAEDAAAKAEEDRKRIAQASVRAADSFEIGQSGEDNLSGQSGLSFSFAGARAETADTMSLVTAQDRLAAGEDAEVVRRETGWHRGVDGRMRFEISDNDARVDMALLANLHRGGFAERAIEHVSYREESDGTYSLTLAPKNPQRVDDFISVRGIPSKLLPSLLPQSALDAIAQRQGEADMIGPNLDDARRVRTPFQFAGFNALPLDVVMDHPKLFAAYPALREIMVRVDRKLGNGATFAVTDYVDGTIGKAIKIGNPLAKDVDSVLLHEIQHGIQDIEGFATGGSPTNAAGYEAQVNSELVDLLQTDKQLDTAYQKWASYQRDMEAGREFSAADAETAEAELLAMPGGKKITDLHSTLDGLADPSSAPIVMRDRYRRLAGEVEARNTQARKNISGLGRKLIPPSKTADVADSDVIVTFNGKEMANAPEPANAQPAVEPATDRATKDSVNAALAQLVPTSGRLPNGLGKVVVANASEIKPNWEPLIGPVDMASEDAGQAQGFYDPRTRTVFLIADHIKAGTEMAVAAHELMHKHGQAVLGAEGWNKLHSTIERWANAPANSTERLVYDEAVSRMEASRPSDISIPEYSTQELFPYAVQIAMEMGVQPSTGKPAGTVAGWLARVRNALKDAWTKITGKPDLFDSQDLVNLAFGIAQRENPAQAGELDGALQGRGLDQFKALDDIFALPKSTATDLQQIARDNGEEVRVRTTDLIGEKLHTLTFKDGTEIRITERKASPLGQDQQVYAFDLVDGSAVPSQIGRPGENPEDVPPTGDVWLDVSRNTPAKYGAVAYNIAATFAHNTGQIFVGDPAGLSDDALRRRTEQMLSSALKFGTTEHLAPHPRQVAGDANLGVPPLKWVYGDHVGNVERMIDVSLDALDNALPNERNTLSYDRATGQFRSNDGNVVQPRASAMGRSLDDYRAGVGKAQAGWRTLARAAYLRSFRGADGRAEGSGILDQSSDDVSRFRGGTVGSAFADPKSRIFYSRDGAVTPDEKKPALQWRDATGRMQFAPGQWLYDRLGDAASPLLTVLGLKAASPELRRQLRQMKLQVQRAQELSAKVATEAAKLSTEDRAMVSDLVEKDLQAGTVPPEHAVKLAALISATMDKQSAELVELGMLSKEGAERWQGTYLPRFYESKLSKKVGDAWADAMRRLVGRPRLMKGIGGKHLKGRGMFETIDPASLENYQALGWEVRDPDYTPGTSTEVQVWRDFNREERQKMGEIRDAGFRFVMGYMQTQRDIALGRMFQNLSNDDRFSSRLPTKDMAVRVPDTKVEGTGASVYGKLAGRYVSKETLSHLSSFDEVHNDALQMYRQAMSLWKEGKTVLNPVAHMNNVVSNMTMAHLAGVSYHRGDKYVGALADFMKGSPMIEDAKDAGLFLGNFSQAELMESMPEDLKKLVNLQEGTGAKVGKTAMAVMTMLLRKPMGKAYEFEDSFFKYMLYKDARQRGLEQQDAIDYAQRYIFTYDDLPKGARRIRDYGIPFFAYTYKAIPALLHTALAHPVRVATPAALLWATTALTYAAMADGDDDTPWDELVKKYLTDAEFRQKAADAKAFDQKHLPTWMRGSTAFFTPKTMRVGYDKVMDLPVFLDISRFIPGGDLFDVTPNAGGIPLPQPITPNHPLLTMAMGMLGNKDMFTGKELVDKNDTVGEAAEKRAAWIYRQVAPAISIGQYHWNRGMEMVAQASGGEITWLPEFVSERYTGVGSDGLPVLPQYGIPQTFGIKVRPMDQGKAEDIERAIDRKLIQSIDADIRQLERQNKNGVLSDKALDKQRDYQREKKDRLKDGLTVDGKKKE